MMMERNGKKSAASIAVDAVMVGMLTGCVASIPIGIIAITNRLDRIENIYFAVEACKAGADLDACEALRGAK